MDLIPEFRSILIEVKYFDCNRSIFFLWNCAMRYLFINFANRYMNCICLKKNREDFTLSKSKKNK